MAIVKLEDVVEQIEFCDSPEIHGWLNRKTGEVFSLPDMTADEIYSAEDDVDRLPEWQCAHAAKLFEIEASDDWIELPDQFEINEYRMMRAFILEQTTDSIQEDLLRSISGRGAFRYFMDTVHRHGIQDDWYRYRDERLKQFAKSWLESEGIEYE